MPRLALPTGLVVVFVVLVFVSATLSAQEWTRFRGPGGQGLQTEAILLAKPTPADVRWRVPVGRGHSSPVLWDEQLFLTEESTDGSQRVLICFDAGTGNRRWQHGFTFEPFPRHKLNSAASETPVVDAERVYLSGASGKELLAMALDHAGKPLWRTAVGRFAAQHGSGASPVLAGGLLVVPDDNGLAEESALVGLDPATGAERWRVPRRTSHNHAAYATPVPFHPAAGGEGLLFASTSHGLTALAPATGKPLWELALGFKQRVVATPCRSGDLVLVQAGIGGTGSECAIVQLPPEDGEPRIVRRLRRNLPYVPSTLALDGRFYLFSDGGIASCVEASTGKTLWRKRLDGPVFSSPVSDGRTVFVTDRDGRLYSLRPGAEPELLGALDLGAPVFATPAIAHGRLYVRTEGELICLGRRGS